MKNPFYLLLLLMVLVACSSKKKIVQDNADVAPEEVQSNNRPMPDFYEATVIDKSEIDGCGILFRMEDGRLLRPVSFPPMSPELKGGMSVSFAYYTAKEMVTICMAEDESINVVQLVLLNDGKQDPCIHVSDPYDAVWMEKVISDITPYSITRYDYKDQFVYYFTGAQRSFLYKCNGELICDVPGKALNDCARRVNELPGKKIIWVMNE